MVGKMIVRCFPPVPQGAARGGCTAAKAHIVAHQSSWKWKTIFRFASYRKITADLPFPTCGVEIGRDDAVRLFKL
jgi:hypothetical protein